MVESLKYTPFEKVVAKLDDILDQRTWLKGQSPHHGYCFVQKDKLRDEMTYIRYQVDFLLAGNHVIFAIDADKGEIKMETLSRDHMPKVITDPDTASEKLSEMLDTVERFRK